jgi:Tat protein secretion system quality control protein TatD with DNase activity
MTDAHCHLRTGAKRHLICEPFSGERGEGDIVFYGVHPWAFLPESEPLSVTWLEDLRERLINDPSAGVGEIGLDRLKEKEISLSMREGFFAQLSLAFELGRNVVLHGAKCWGQVVAAIKKLQEEFKEKALSLPKPSFLFHGFSRSGGLIPEIAKLNGFISVGPAVLNDHATNYRKLVAEIPSEILLLETDATSEENIASLEEIAEEVASLRSTSPSAIIALNESNLTRFLSPTTWV